MIKVEILGTSCIMCAHALGGYPYSITSVRMRTSNGRTTIVMFCIALSWWLLVLTSVRPKELPEYARPTRRVAQRCANWLMSWYSHVWAVCRVYGTRPNYPLGQHRRKTDWKIDLIISFACDCCITLIGSHLLSISLNIQAMCYYIFVKARHSYTTDDGIATETMTHA